MITNEKLLVRALRGETLKRPPFWFMRQAGRCLPEFREIRARAGSFLDLCYNPKLAAEVTLQPIRRFGMDASIVFADILLVPDGLGQKLDYVDGKGPVLEPIRSLSDLSRLSLEKLHSRANPVYETVSRVAGSLPEDITLIGFAGAPWTVACYMVEGGASRDHAVIKHWAYKDPDSFEKLMELLVVATTEYLRKQIEAGAEVIQLFDTWAGVTNEAGFLRWCIEPVKKIVTALRMHFPDIPIIGFPKGAGAGYLQFVQAAGVNGIGLDWSVPLEWARDEIQSQTTVQGNLDPRLVVVGGKAMDTETNRVLEILGQGPLIFNLGHGILPETPVEHVSRLAELLRA